MGYWDATDRFLSKHGRGPKCPSCGSEMFPEDDHGRFSCICGGGTFDVVSETIIPVLPIPQVDTAGMSDEEKAQIPCINRLNSTPTKAETNLFKISIRGPDCMDDPEYWAAVEVIEKERKK